MIKPVYFKLRVLVLPFLLLLSAHVHSQSMDAKLLNKLNPNTTHVNPTWDFVSNSIQPLSVAAPVTMLTVALITKDADLKQNAFRTGEALLINALVTTGMKNSFQRTRPFNAYPGMITLQGTAAGYSFPSGHTSNAFALATSLTLSFNKKWYVAVPAYGFAAATAYSRMYRGAHYPTDVLGGMIVGTGTSYLTWKLQKLFLRRSRVGLTVPHP
ncbi:phosphatase PAP2 family protein [Mucilaginibacter sp. KACC 22063]|uniref:phosphatase PAP2 family protein n=1 Tax=Mucilaginibacter sp. KACC 22063 TaxID=3025666 RepID=UPI002365E488|nr:phosphatase PAP2 family protein [Mucilaginibacter sp. KACC 22063]WDF56196.1 phosphatase PAP2 family protein [Mucilaginibacter sp. KACC 22063]